MVKQELKPTEKKEVDNLMRLIEAGGALPEKFVGMDLTATMAARAILLPAGVLCSDFSWFSVTFRDFS